MGREDGDRDGLEDTEIPYKFKFTEPDFANQPAGDGLVLSPAGFRSAPIHTQQAPHQSGYSNNASTMWLYSVPDQLGPLNSHYCL